MMQVSCNVRDRIFQLKNPVMTAPGGFGNIIEYKEFVELGRLGAVIPNSMLKEDGSPNQINKFLAVPQGYLSSFGPNNMGLATFIREILPQLPESTAPVIVDLKAKSIEEMGESVALAAETERIAAIEINLNCPYASPEPLYYKNPEKFERLLETVRRMAGEKILIAKAPGGFYPMAEMTGMLERCGIDLFVPFNCVDGCAVDIRARTVQGGGFFGSGIKPLALSRCREAVASCSIPIIGAGGITCGEDVIAYIMAGAFAVQVGSANLTRPDFMSWLIDDVERLMKELEITSLDEIRGTASMAKVGLF